MRWTDATTTDVITGVTLLLGIMLCIASGTWFHRRTKRHWWNDLPTDEGVHGMTLLWVGMVFIHIALSRMYHDDIVFRLFDLNSLWTLVLRTVATVMVFVSVGRVLGRISMRQGR